MGKARYAVTYARDPIPPAIPPTARHEIFGRLRLSINDSRP
jgi:hypothetical protein